MNHADAEIPQPAGIVWDKTMIINEYPDAESARVIYTFKIYIFNYYAFCVYLIPISGLNWGNPYLLVIIIDI